MTRENRKKKTREKSTSSGFTVLGNVCLNQRERKISRVKDPNKWEKKRTQKKKKGDRLPHTRFLNLELLLLVKDQCVNRKQAGKKSDNVLTRKRHTAVVN